MDIIPIISHSQWPAFIETCIQLQSKWHLKSWELYEKISENKSALLNNKKVSGLNKEQVKSSRYLGKQTHAKSNLENQHQASLGPAKSCENINFSFPLLNHILESHQQSSRLSASGGSNYTEMKLKQRLRRERLILARRSFVAQRNRSDATADAEVRPARARTAFSLCAHPTRFASFIELIKQSRDPNVNLDKRAGWSEGLGSSELALRTVCTMISWWQFALFDDSEWGLGTLEFDRGIDCDKVLKCSVMTLSDRRNKVHWNRT